MRRVGVLGALVLLIVVNIAVLGAMAWNRMGRPEASVRLTERELGLGSLYAADPSGWDENGIALELKVSGLDGWPNWLDKAKLQSLGFTFEGDGRGPRHYKETLPRRVYLVLEFDGPAWQQLSRSRERLIAELWLGAPSSEASEETSPQALDEALRSFWDKESRLVAIDAGTEPTVLRQRYTDRARYLIVPAIMRMPTNGSSQPRGEWRDGRGSIKPVTAQIHVPIEHHAALNAALSNRSRDLEAGEARYEVVLNYGQRLEPWISEIRPLEPN